MRLPGFLHRILGGRSLEPADRSPLGGRWHTVFDWRPGAWQQDASYPATPEQVTAYWAVFAAVTFIAGDFAKCAPRVMEFDQQARIWRPTMFRRPLLKNPNGYQTAPEFFFSWAASKLLTGNTYALKNRNERGFVTALHVLDSCKVMPLVSDVGEVFYELARDNLAGVEHERIVVPASEIIHDRMYPLYHPLVGISPLHACSVAAAQGLAIQGSSRAFFANNAIPGGILTAPGKISDDTAKRLKESWQENYSGRNSGRVAVLGDDLKFQQMSVPAEDAQLVEQLKMTAEMVCACFHLPGYKIGVGQMPTVNNAAQLNQEYFDRCLHPLFETAEARLDHGLELGDSMECWFDTGNLLRLDPEARFKSHSEAIRGGWMSPNEARQAEDMPPVEGGESPLMQQQMYSLAALAGRDASAGAPDSPALDSLTARMAALEMRQKDIGYFGTWRQGEYRQGQAVTHSGGLWIAERDTDQRPGETGSGWRLAVKSGDARRLER